MNTIAIQPCTNSLSVMLNKRLSFIKYPLFINTSKSFMRIFSCAINCTCINNKFRPPPIIWPLFIKKENLLSLSQGPLHTLSTSHSYTTKKEIGELKNTSSPSPAPCLDNWNYKRQGRDWTDICMCKNRQSPINLIHNNVKIGNHTQDLFINLLDSDPKFYSITNNGHTLQFGSVYSLSSEKPYPGGFGYVLSNGNKYEVIQFHFHSPSEHTFEIERQRHCLELHIVCRNTDTDLIVVAVTFLSHPNAPLNAFLLAISKNSQCNLKNNTFRIIDSSQSTPIQLSSLFERNTNIPFYTYLGSLTTPPCLEIVTWYIKSNPILVSAEQLKYYRKVFHYPGTNGNYRVTQNTDENQNNTQTIYSTIGTHSN